MSLLERPPLEEVPAYYHNYVNTATGDDLQQALQNASDRAWAIQRLLPVDRHEHRYAPGKWSVKEVFQHLIDAERIFAYRALRFARNDAMPLPGFEENDYVPEARCGTRGMHAIMREHDAVRAATIELFRGFDDIALMRTGTANNNSMSVRAIGWIIAGHAMHHMRVIEECYLT